MAYMTHNITLRSRTITSLASACQNCSKNQLLPHISSRNMSSHPKDKNNPKYGHLPLSTSGPEDCALTVLNAHSLPPSSYLTNHPGFIPPPLPLPQQRQRLSAQRTQGLQALRLTTSQCADVGHAGRTRLCAVLQPCGSVGEEYVHDEYEGAE